MLRKKEIKRLLSVLLAAVLAVCSALSIGAEQTTDGVGMNISGLSSVTFGGDHVDGSIFAESKLTVINIWQRWYGPCWAELPYFQQIHEYYSETPEADVRIWGALYYGDNPSTIQQAIDFCEENGYTWDQMLMCDELLAVISEEGQDYIHIPQTLIVGAAQLITSTVIQSFSSIRSG